MGAAYCEEILLAKLSGESWGISEIEEKFSEIRSQCQYNSGHGGYTGTFAEKSFVHIHKETLVSVEAAQKKVEENDKWNDAEAYRLQDGRIYIGGWCSS